MLIQEREKDGTELEKRGFCILKKLYINIIEVIYQKFYINNGMVVTSFNS